MRATLDSAPDLRRWQDGMKMMIRNLVMAAVSVACVGCASIAARSTTDAHRPHPKFARLRRDYGVRPIIMNNGH